MLMRFHGRFFYHGFVSENAGIYFIPAFLNISVLKSP